MEEQSASYKCPYCDAPLRWIPGEQLGCAACGNRFEPEVVKKLSAFENDQAPFDWGDYKEKFAAGAQNLPDRSVYLCRSCGAAVETDGTTAATRCPFCDNEIVLTEKLTGGLRPNGVIPFALSKQDAIGAVKKHFRGKRLLPRNFREGHTLGKIQGVYVPFWLYDAGVDGETVLECTKRRYYSDDDYDYTETKHYLVSVRGSMRFRGIPVDGSEKADDDLMDALEPFDYSGVLSFDPAYLSGFLADRFDSDPDRSLPRASQRMKSCADAAFSGEVTGFDSVRPRGSNLSLTAPAVRYVLLPVYFLNVGYHGKNYRFAVNGQTGKTVGELPVSKAKSLGYFGGWAAAVSGAVSLLLYLLLR